MTELYITHPYLEPVKHGFFTRAVNGMVDLSAVATGFEIGLDQICRVNQSHSAQVVTVGDGPFERIHGDGLVTAQNGQALAILTADCQPVLMVDHAAQVIAAVHAGWRGAKDGILENAVEKMQELGAKPAQICAVVGPSISQPNYEVSESFFEEFITDDPDHHRFFAQGARPEKYQFDLPGFGLACLRRAGVERAAFCGHCTYADETRFFSHRRATHQQVEDKRRLISVIML